MKHTIKTIALLSVLFASQSNAEALRSIFDLEKVKHVPTVAHKYTPSTPKVAPISHEFDLNYTYFNFEKEGKDTHKDGGTINYQLLNNNVNLGVASSLKIGKFDTVDFGYLNVGLIYNAAIIPDRLYVKPEVGMFHAKIDETSDTSYYAGASLDVHIIKNKLVGSVGYKRDDFTHDHWDKENISLSLRYIFDNNIYMNVKLEDQGDLSNAHLGLGYKF